MNVESGSIWWIGKHTETRLVENRGETSDVVASVAKAIATAFPDRKKP